MNVVFHIKFDVFLKRDCKDRGKTLNSKTGAQIFRNLLYPYFWFQNGTIMANVTVKNIPDSLYKLLQNRAKQNRRSINNEVIVLLERYVTAGNVDFTKVHESAEKARALLKGKMVTEDEINELKSWGRE
jgi:plasmid stability protein